MAACMRRLNYPRPGSTGITRLVMEAGSSHELDPTLPDITMLGVAEFSTEAEANSLWERVVLDLINHGVGPGNVRTDVDGIFEELALNAAQHSCSPLPCRATLECFTSGDEIVYILGIADAGVGIPVSLRSNPAYAHLANDAEAIARATEQDVTGTTQQRGAGLHHVMERVRAYRGELTIISGAGFLMVRDGGEPVLSSFDAPNLPPYDGTIGLVSLPISAL